MNEVTADEFIKELVDGYIDKVYQRPIPPVQQIEVRLAFYAGMKAMFNTGVKIAQDNDDEETILQLTRELIDAVQNRAMKLNQERQKR